MAMKFEKPIICPTLIGRDEQCEALGHFVSAAREGHGNTVVISGEAGIGKSRLLAEAQRRAAQRGMLILQGTCFEADRSVPYAPIIDLLRVYLADRSPDLLEKVFASYAPILIKLLPELAELLPQVMTIPPVQPDHQQYHLSNALIHLLIDVAASRPVLLTVEDIHWADEATLELLLRLSRRIHGHPLCFLLTYRSDEAQPSLVRFLAELSRQRLATELDLMPLSEADVATMLPAILDLEGPVRREFRDVIYELTDGNPFFIEEILKSLVSKPHLLHAYASGRWDRNPVGELSIPRTIGDAVRRRVETLSKAAGDTVVLAAVAGRRFDFALLQELSGQEEHELLLLMKELVGAQLVVEDSAEQFAFRHALTRQAVYAGLLARERRELHRRVAEALERRIRGLKPDLHVGELAYHYHEAGVWAKTLEYAGRAGERAQRLYAPREAVGQFNRAIGAANHLQVAVPVPLYRARGLAYEMLGDFERALADHQAALRAASDTGDRHAEWQALLDLGFLWSSRDYARTGNYFRRALDLARQIGDPTLLAHSLNRVGNRWMNIDEPLDALRCHREALVIFQDLGDRRGVAETLDLLGMAYYGAGDLVQSAASYHRAVGMFEELGDRRGLSSSLTELSVCGGSYESEASVAATGPVDFTHYGEESLRIAREIGWRAGEAYAATNLAVRLGARGHYARALALAREALAVADEIEHLQWRSGAHCALGRLYCDLLLPSLARPHLEQARALADDNSSVVWARVATAYLAMAYRMYGDLTAAAALLSPDLPDQTLVQRLPAFSRAELLLAQGEAAEALGIVDALFASAVNLSMGHMIPRLAHLRGDALAATGRLAEAEDALQAARASARLQGARPLLWRIGLSLGNLYRAQGRRDQAGREFAQARAGVEELAADVPDGDLREGFLCEATRLIPSPTPRQEAKQAFGGLTQREREVAGLVAEGKSNREIADSLVISEHTVASHVSNILGKLALSSRVHITVWALERELTPRPERQHGRPNRFTEPSRHP